MTLSLDTNVLVRLLTRDHIEQYNAALGLVATAIETGQSVVVLPGVILETEWVLRSRYKLCANEIQKTFSAILETIGVDVHEPQILEEALRMWRDNAGADFADCMHVAASVHLGGTLATFDQGAARLPGAMLIAL